MSGGRTTQLLVSVFVSASGVCFIFLTAALSVVMATEFGLSGQEIGSAVALSYLTAAAAVRRIARVMEGRPLPACVRLACGYNALLLAVAAVALHGRWTVIGFAVAAGIGLGLTGVAGNLVLSGGGRVNSRMGLLFGLKQSGASVAGLLAGAALAASGGLPWRWSYVAFAGLALTVAVLGPLAVRAGASTSDDDPAPATAIGWSGRVLWTASLFGTVVAGALAAFSAPTMIRWGLEPSAAGLVLVYAGLGSIVARVGLGAVADRWPALSLPMLTVSVLAAALVVIAVVLVPALRGAGLAVAYALGWGWPGLAFLAGYQRMPDRPARAVATVLNATALGLGLGPVVVRLLWEWRGPSTAWLVVAAVAVVAGTAGTLLTWPVARAAWPVRQSVKGNA